MTLPNYSKLTTPELKTQLAALQTIVRALMAKSIISVYERGQCEAILRELSKRNEL